MVVSAIVVLGITTLACVIAVLCRRALASLVPDPMQFMDQYGMRCLAAREVSGGT